MTANGASEEAGQTHNLTSLTLSEALEISRHAEVLSTGSPGLDGLLGGGYAQGRITEVFGPSNSGKSQLAMQAAVMAASRGWKCVYVDTESTFRPERVVQIAESRGFDAKAILGNVYSVRARDVHGQTRVQRRVTQDELVRSAKLLIVDTVTKNFSLEFPEKERVGRRQGALGVYLNRIAVDAYLHRRVVLLTNRVVSITRDGKSQDVSVGGLTLGRFVSSSIRLQRLGSSLYADLEFPRTKSPPIECHLTERGFE